MKTTDEIIYDSNIYYYDKDTDNLVIEDTENKLLYFYGSIIKNMEIVFRFNRYEAWRIVNLEMLNKREILPELRKTLNFNKMPIGIVDLNSDIHYVKPNGFVVVFATKYTYNQIRFKFEQLYFKLKYAISL